MTVEVEEEMTVELSDHDAVSVAVGDAEETEVSEQVEVRADSEGVEESTKDELGATGAPTAV
jgi:hypothetical protein